MTDGTVRDLPEAEAVGFQFFSAHVSVSHAYVHMVDFGIPVKVGGLWIRPAISCTATSTAWWSCPGHRREDPGGGGADRGSRAEMIAVCQQPGVTVEELKAARTAMRQSY